jgi:ATP-binding cassette, subfamily F, member 3
MGRYVAFLRGMNLGKRRLKNEELRRHFEEMGFEEVATFRASGNVIFAVPGRESETKLERRVEAELGARLEYEVPVFLRTIEEVAAIAAMEPFPAKALASSQGKLQVSLLAKKPTAAARKKVLALATDEDRLAVEGRELYWLPSGGLLDSDLDLKAIEAILGADTRRTMGTIEQIAAKHAGRRVAGWWPTAPPTGNSAGGGAHYLGRAMAIATATSLDVYVGGKLLFEEVSFKLEPRERMTLSGRNGAGKSTLLRVLSGELKPDSGSLTLHRAARVALHDQRPPRESQATLGEYVLSGRGDMIATEAELERLEARMSGGDTGEETLREYSAAQGRLEAGGGYRWRDDVFAVLRGLGFGPEQAERSLSTFSGGELTRASLARALAAKPDLLLLDEPTNHLDIPSLEWLERYLVELDAAVVLVAHDRWFLEAVGTSVLELEAQRARFFAGPWHAWRQEQAARQIALGKAIERQQAEIARMERFVERFRYKATKARQAQSRVKKIEKAKRDGPAAERRDTRSLRFSFKPPERPGRVVLKLVNGTIEVPGRTLLAGANLEIERGEHVVLVGANGTGKTTLIETLAGRKEPSSGSVRTGHNVHIAYLSQHADTAAGSGTVLDAAKRETGLSENKARALLGGFLFSGGDADKQLSDISGGEQRRLSLAILVASGANVLILDEPTNHLDIESREALEDALVEYEGAVLLVSHDRALLEAVGSRTLVAEDGRLESHPSGWAEYQLRRDERATQAAAAAKPAPAKRPKKAAKPSQKAARRAARLEEKIAAAEEWLRGIEEELADPAAWASPGRSERATERHAEAKAAVEELYAEWELAQRQAETEATPS